MLVYNITNEREERKEPEMTYTKYNNIITSLAWELEDADLDAIKSRVAYYTSEESGYALGCDYDKVFTDVMHKMA